METLSKEAKIYSEFFTNLAVAWFTAGVIAPFFAKPFGILETAFFSLIGVLGALISLRFAVLATQVV